MHFIGLKYLKSSDWEPLSPSERLQILDDARRFELALAACGHFFAAPSPEIRGNPLLLQLRNGQADAAIAEEHGEVLAGLLFLDARDMNHAIGLLSQHPVLGCGAIRIHPAKEEEVL